jgi:hypothetical protein
MDDDTHRCDHVEERVHRCDVVGCDLGSGCSSCKYSTWGAFLGIENASSNAVDYERTVNLRGLELLCKFAIVSEEVRTDVVVSKPGMGRDKRARLRPRTLAKFQTPPHQSILGTLAHDQDEQFTVSTRLDALISVKRKKSRSTPFVRSEAAAHDSEDILSAFAVRAWRTSKGTSGVDGLRKYGALPSIAVQGKPSVKASKRETGEMLIRPSQAGWMLGIDPEIELLRYFASLTLSSK